ncbi:iron siderophore-binding protein [Enemella evansiae]|uniref:iron-siderophore ABC transporter substrate-binding protein n=1 Tax=Enemella evansiae TaxID=2016499 RepID=UPI000B97785A|nr:iron-siderophore ABC transporter substrate-binding protein [Enemella evansiae]OYN93557.1 iron siderophore-binding protein [Enemella evansiae]
MALIFTSCGSPTEQAGGASGAGQAAESGAFPVTIDSALGAVTIEKAPERVVTIGWGSQDVALALGIVPVGMQDMSGDSGDQSGILPWDRDRVGDARPQLLKYTTDSVPFEQILQLEPDVILAVNSGLTQQQYDKLSEIAPTLAYPGKPWLTSWEDQTTLVGKALGRSAQADQLVTQTKDLIARSRSEHPEFADKTIAFASGTKPDGLNLYLAGDSRMSLLEQLGFRIAPSVPTTGASFAVPVSKENLATIDADVLVAWYLNPQLQQSLQGDRLFTAIPAVERQGYVALTDPPMVYATSAVSVLSLPWMLDKYLPLLQSAAEGKSPL